MLKELSGNGGCTVFDGRQSNLAPELPSALTMLGVVWDWGGCVLSTVSKDDLRRLLEQEKRAKAGKPKRGPKPKDKVVSRG